MSTDDGYRLVGISVEKLSASLGGDFNISIRGRVPARFGELDWVMHHVTGDDGLLAPTFSITTLTCRASP
ncbi:hypothetical protein [Williamsia muralis]|uniref:hypothetical protein n=1 Tax=Williamsia marianensis TaxID=85044 RepID=UPI001057951F|nr:hypothetical protein [Williamsia marianensis]